MGYQKVVIESAANTVAQNTTGSAATLTTARAIALSGGDVTGTANFDGSASIAINATIDAKVVEGSMIADGTVTALNMGADSVGSSELITDSVGQAEINGLTSLGYTSGKVVVAGASEGSFLYGNVLNNATITLAGGNGMKDTMGAYTTNQGTSETVTISMDINDLTDLTGADNDLTIQSGDMFAVADASDSNATTKKITMEKLAEKLSAGSNDGLTASAGQLTVDLSTLSAMTDPQPTDDYFVIIDDGITKKMQPTRYAEKLAGTGISNTDSVLNLNTTQNFHTITGQTSLSLASDTSVTGNLTISGDLQVTGQTITTSTETLEIADNLIHLNSDLGSGTGVDTGIVAERGSTGDNACLFWDHSKEAWCIGTNSAVGFPATSSMLMVNVENDGAPSGSETNVGGMVYDTSNNEMYVRTS